MSNSTEEAKKSKKKSFIKLDNKIIVITEGVKGLKAEYLSDEEAFDLHVFDVPVEELLKNDINEATNDAYSELKRTFKETLKKNVLRIVGFDQRWQNEWEIDHCNGRSSVVTEYIASKVKEMFTAEFNSITQEEINQLLKPVKKTLLKEIKDCFEREAKSKIRENIYQEAQTFVKKTIEQQVQKYQKSLTKQVEKQFFGTYPKSEDSEE